MSPIRIAAATLACALAGTALAAQEALPREDLEALAELIVDAEVTSLEPRWAGTRGGDVETAVGLAVERTLAGPPADTLELVLQGGRLGELGTWVPDEPVLLPDHRYRLLLVHDDGGRWRVLGGPAGAAPLDPLPCYDLSGIDWSYQAHPVEEDFSLNVLTFPDEFVSDALIEETYTLAVGIWNVEGEALVVMPYGGQTTDTQYGGGNNDVNVAMFEAQTWGSTLAKTVYNYTDGSDMVDCDIQFYGANNNGTIPWTFDLENGAPPGTYDFVHTTVHELGHCLGLSHSAYQAAIMYAYSEPGTGWEKRHLHDDDIAGLQAIYGAATVELELVDLALVPVDEDGDGTPEPGETAALTVALTNHGSGTAYEVGGVAAFDGDWAHLEVDEAAMGDVAPGAGSGSLASALGFELVLDDACEGPRTGQLTVEAGDAAGHTDTKQWSVGVECPVETAGDDDGADDDDGLVQGEDCSCGASGRGGGWVAALLLAAALGCRRRRVPSLPTS